jgi:very-short-patch-repair endonuclease
MQPYPPKQKINARRLRHTQTDAEKKLWTRLRNRQVKGAKFRRQHPIGLYITDFCCVENGLVVELDGGQHAEQVQADQKRSRYLERQGYRVLRFWDNEVLADVDAVVQQIYQSLDNPHPYPLPKRAREKTNEL